MHRHLMNLLPALLACAPILFVLGMLVLALPTALPRLARAAGRRGAGDESRGRRRLPDPAFANTEGRAPGRSP